MTLGVTKCEKDCKGLLRQKKRKRSLAKRKYRAEGKERKISQGLNVSREQRN